MHGVAAVGIACSLGFLPSAARGQGFSVAAANDGSPPMTRPRTSVTIGTTGGTTTPGVSEYAGGATDRRGSGIRPSVSLRDPGEYGGITPGTAHGVPRWWMRAVRRNARSGGRAVIAWPGFQVTPQGSRIFLAVSSPPQITPNHRPGRLVYRVRNAVVPIYNNRRALETGAFDTPVTRAFLRTVGRDVDLVIETRTQSEPQMTQSGASGTGETAMQFVYFDFPPFTAPTQPAPGDAPAARRGGRDVQPMQGIRPAAGGQVDDNEAPPPVQR